MKLSVLALSTAGLVLGGLVAHVASVAFLGAVQYDWNDSHSAVLRTLGTANRVAAEAQAMAQAAQAAVPKAVDGAEVYNRICVACHQATGTGLAGAFPPLAGSEWVAKDPKILARIVLGGIQGPIEVKGGKYASAMPSFSTLSDAEIAAVLTHVRGSFGNSAGAVGAALVKDVRAQGGVKPGGWTAESVGQF